MVLIHAARALRPLMLGITVVAALTCVSCGGTTATKAPVPAAHDHHKAGSTSSSSSSDTDPSTTTSSTSSADLPGDGKPVVTIGDKNYTEQFVLGQLYLQALEAQGFTVNINQNIGPTDVTLQALKSGSLAMYPEYLNTFNSAIAGYPHGFGSRHRDFRQAQRYAAAHGLELLAPTPFSDTYAIGVTDAYGARHRLHSLSDLRRVASTLTIGGAAPFQTVSPGLPALARIYGVTPASFKALAVGDQYQDLDDGGVQAAYVNTTDGQLASGDYRLLRDPLHVFGFGNVVPVLSSSAATTEGPAFTATIERVDALLTTSTMRQLNALVDVADQSAADVAQQFLETHGLIPPPSS